MCVAVCICGDILAVRDQPKVRAEVPYLVDVILLRVPDRGQVQNVRVELGWHVIDVDKALGHTDVLVHLPAHSAPAQVNACAW